MKSMQKPERIKSLCIYNREQRRHGSPWEKQPWQNVWTNSKASERKCCEKTNPTWWM